tara:strand:- start:458 stop:757 length:300 start_codon:yes stop_codon:yes gene_type:complete
MIVDLNLHRRQKQAEERGLICDSVNIIFDIVSDDSGGYGMHPDAILHTNSKDLFSAMEKDKKTKIKFCEQLRDYFGYFANTLEKDSEQVRFVMNYIEEE